MLLPAGYNMGSNSRSAALHGDVLRDSFYLCLSLRIAIVSDADKTYNY